MEEHDIPPLKSWFRVNEWNELVQWIQEDLEDEEKRNVLYFYQDQMETYHEDNEHGSQQTFYDVIDSDTDKLQAARQLHQVLRDRQLHSDMGENMADKVQQYIDRLLVYQNQFEVETDQLFIGREDELTLITNILQHHDYIKGVCLCGIGGQGKSLLARNICRNMATSTAQWAVAKADLRNKSSTADVIKSVLTAAKCEFPMHGQQEQLENIFQQCILNTQQDILFCLDDCDQVVQIDQYDFISFVKNAMRAAEESSRKIKFLMTMREKLPTNDSKKSNKYTLKMSDRLAEVELHELEQADAVQLFIECSQTEDIDDHITSAIVKECACSPLAVTVVAKLVQNGRFTPNRLLFHLQMDEKNVTKGLQIDGCIRQGIENLSNDLQKAIISLSVFQSSPFDIVSANKIIGSSRFIDGESSIMQKLYNSHLIEIEEYQQGKIEDVVKSYSLHPLVFRYISEWKQKPSALEGAYESAVLKFVSLYEGVINTIVKSMQSKYWRGQRKLESHKVHILKFYEVLSENPEMLKEHSKRTDAKDLLAKKRVSDLADILLSLVQKRRMFQSEADRAKKAGNNGVYVFWMVEKADVFLILHDKVEIAMEILDSLTDGKFAALRGLHDEPFYPVLVHALFHKVKGLCRWKQDRHQEALDHLHLSIKFYGRCQPSEPYEIFVARVKCYMGQVYLDIGEVNQADQILREGHRSAKGMVQTRSNRDTDELAKELSWDIPRYYYMYAKIKLRKAKATDPECETRRQLLEKALEDLEKGIKLDQLLKLNHLDNYYAKCKLRADVNVEKGLLNEALVDANYVLDRRRALLQPPHTNYTESVYQVGRIYLLIGNDLNKRGEHDKASRNWICSSDYFKELKDCHLKDGGISVTNPVFQDIKRDHLEVTRLTNSKQVKQLTAFYTAVESGVYSPEKASSIKAMKQMMWTPMEMVKKFFGGGGQEFGDKEGDIAKLENMERVQHERMIHGEPSGGARRDSGMGHSSSDLGDSFSSGGSMSAAMNRLHLEKSLSLEDNVFEESGDFAGAKSRQPSKKRQKTIDESQEH